MKKLLLAAAFAAAAPLAALAEGQTHHIAVHVDDGDPRVMNMALNNVENVISYYEEQGDKVVVEVVAYGPGLMMYLDGSPVSSRLSTMSLEHEGVTFAACANTMDKMSEKKGSPVELVSEATIVPSGVVRLVELQGQGYAYIRP